MRLDSLGKPYLVQAIQNSGKPPAVLGTNSIPVKQMEAPTDNSSTPNPEQSLGRVLEFISKHRREQKKDQKGRGKKVAQEYKRVESNLGPDPLEDQPKGQKLNIKA